MPNAHDFGATNEPHTCLWCGAKLRIEPMRSKWHGKDEYGWEGNGFFCTLRCGEAFGKAFARIGRRLQPKEKE